MLNSYGIYPFHDNLPIVEHAGYLPVHLGFRNLQQHEHLDLHNNHRKESDYLLHFTTQGKGIFIDHIKNTEVEVPAGSAFLTPLPSATSYKSIPMQSWEMFWLFFRGKGASLFADELITNNGSHVFQHLTNGPSLNAMKRLLNHQIQKDLHPAQASGICCEILHGLSYTEESKCPQAFTKACEYIKKNYRDPNLSIADVASHSGYSRAHFSREFKKHLDCSPIEWLCRQRLREAVDLICSTTQTMSEISFSIGFNEPAYFNTVFKKIYGYPPGKLRSFGTS